ncbi:MAG TPA: type II toxin-antitoxin system RelB/DinJ family antitoxin [Steroidobacteraceae bacterium]|nr:type II toxin-antitoxin system RelB/DinJ family antitoxin [Steroidobacteraceae bacterium]
MKKAVVRARIEDELKLQASAVLKANGLELSDAIRLFLRQVVQKGGLPFTVRRSAVRVVQRSKLWAMKRTSQARDRELLARGEIKPEALMFLKPSDLEGARVQWPKARLRD